MGKRGGPCQGPGEEEGSICGITEIGDKCDWRTGGRFKPEHKGKACCTKNRCRIALGVVPDTKLAKEEAAPAPAPAAGGGLSGLLDVVTAALSGQSAPAAAPAAASATVPSASASPTAPVAAVGRRGDRGKAAASAAAAAAAASPAPPEPPGPPDGAPPVRTRLEQQQVVLDSLQPPDGWSFGLAQLQGGPQLYFWPSALPEQRWTTWRSPLDAPWLKHVAALEGHQRIKRSDGTFDSKWRVHGRFSHDEDKFSQAEPNSAESSASEFEATLWVSAEEVASHFEGTAHFDIMDGLSDLQETDSEFKEAIMEYLEKLMQTSAAADRAAVEEFLGYSADSLSFYRRREERNAQMALDSAREDAIKAVAEAPAERLAAIMAAAAGRPAAAASSAAAAPPAAAAGRASPAAPSPRATRATSSSAASPTATAAPAAPHSAPRARRSPRPADPEAAEPPPRSNAAGKRAKTS